MAPTEKRAVKDILDELLGCEIPEIQTVARQLSERIGQLEERSNKLQQYVSQIEKIATEEAEALAEERIKLLLRDLEQTLGEMGKRIGAISNGSAESAKPQPAEKLSSESSGDENVNKQEPVEQKEEVSQAEPAEEAQIQEGSGSLPLVDDMERPAARLRKIESYTTPEGLTVKRSRR